jgi:ribosomal protein S12 methylthiotransferase accessory factor
MRTRLWTDRSSVDVQLFDLTTDIGIPVVFAIMRRSAEIGPVPCQGLAARLGPQRAARKAIHEAGQNFPFIRNLLTNEKEWRPADDFSNVTNFDYHFLTYLRRPDLVPAALAFFDACDRRVALSAMPDRSTGRILGDIESAVARLRALGHETIVVDVASPDVAEVGLSVVRVLVPGLAPLHGNHTRPFFGVRRLVDAPQRFGWSTDGGFNPMPHTFP